LRISEHFEYAIVGELVMRIVCISDTHGKHVEIEKIPDGDLLIHAGDSLGISSMLDLMDLNEWLVTLPLKILESRLVACICGGVLGHPDFETGHLIWIAGSPCDSSGKKFLRMLTS
jgi:predicted phosphodiesterase